MSQSAPITSGEIIEDGIFDLSKKSAEQFAKALDDLIVGFKKVNKEANAYTKANSNPKTAKELKAYTEALEKAKASRTGITEAEKEAAKVKKELEKQQIANDKAEKALLKEQEKQAKQTERNTKLTAEQNRAYNVASRTLNELRKNYKDLAVSGQANTAAAKALLDQIQKLDTELKNVDASTGQYNREVGNYANKVKEAINQSDIFTKSLGGVSASNAQIINGLKNLNAQYKNLKEGLKSAEGVGQKLNLTLKAGGIALLIGAFTALAAAFKSSDEGALRLELILNKITATFDVLVGSIAQVGFGLAALGDAFKSFFSGDFSKASEEAGKGIDQIKGSFDGFGAAVQAQIPALDALTIKVYAYRDALRGLEIELLKINQDEEDFREIFADSTLPLNNQLEALEKANELRRKGLNLSLTIADKNLEITKDEIEIQLRKNRVSEEDIALARKQGLENISNSKLSGKLNAELKDQLKERVKAQLEAFDKVSDLPRIEAQEERAIFQQRILDEVELLRSKKLGADGAVQILTDQLADERNQLEERRVFAEKLRQANEEGTRQETQTFQKGVKEQIDFKDLIATKDAVLLAGKLKSLYTDTLSLAQQTALAKIVKEAQDNEIANDKILAKLEEEEIKRKEKIASLERDIASIQTQTSIDIVKSKQGESLSKLNEANSNILVAERAFNAKLAEERRKAFAETEALTESEFKLKEDQLRQSANNETLNITTNDNQIRAEEEKKIQEKLNADLIRLEIDKNKTIGDLRKKELEELRAIEIKKLSIVLEEAAAITSNIGSELDKRNQIQDKAQSQQISNTQNSIDKQRDLANKGLDNQLAFEEQKLAQQQLKQIEAAEKQQREKEILQMVEAYFNAYNARLNEPNANPNTAPALALGDVLLAKGIAKGLVQFAAEGNDDVQGAGTTKSDSIPFMLSKHEGVVKAEANMENKGVVKSLNNDTFDKLYMPRMELDRASSNITSSASNNMYSSMLLHEQMKTNKLLNVLVKKPVATNGFDNLGNLVTRIKEGGKTKVTTHKMRL